MHILITGAAGMIGRKLVARLVDDGSLNGQPIEQLTLIDVTAPQRPAKFAGKVETAAVDIANASAVPALVKDRPDV
ncbi:MAG TPA: NAD-dependent epimerase/dehydratase family protein, partial [Xanthobacteraceae bacterium]